MSAQENAGRQPVGENTGAWIRRLVPLAIVLFVLQAIGTVIAIARKLPYEVGGHGDPDNVARDFLMGGGTALSGPFIVLLILALLVVLARRRDRWGTLALVGVVILGTMAAVFGAQEPIVGRMLQASPFGLFEAIVIAQSWGSILLVLAIVVVSILELVARIRSPAS